MKTAVYVIGAAIVAFILLILIFEYLALFALFAAILGLSVIVAMVLFGALMFLLILVALPYYIIKKKPEVQEYGNYEIENQE
uniref:Membrane protein n=1 Tax=uncultured organism TaxID=155900 RepID=M1PVA6_9ZZZZ|nr:membrane protein [uncultured organism]